VFSVVEWNLSGQEERWTERDGDIDGETVYEAGLISLGQNAERFISWTAL
jgi:hypothetical protein